MSESEMFITLPANAPSRGNKFRVMKREADGFVHGIGIVVADNKPQADYRTRQLFGRNLNDNEAVWAEEMERVA
jgi:hypothetical protein